ncbi:MAG: DbpA RNA binding domain-containing protein, partial [Acidiferrobacterales bacterium]|nr:DbpA RNA binding domain-containing protein [Acidiferrobacterales bacterium]
IAAAAAFLAQGETPLILDEKAISRDAMRSDSRSKSNSPRSPRSDRGDRRGGDRERPPPKVAATPLTDFPDVEMQRFKLEVGRVNKVKPGNIVGAIANEAELESKYIGEIEIREDYSTVDLPADMPKGVMSILKKARVAGKPLALTVYQGAEKTTRHTSGPKKKSYNSRKPKSDQQRKPKSDYANRKRKERSKK